MSGCRRINMWSGPRNASTAMMYAWRQRSDTTVWDEPMYGHYLMETGVDHPDRERILAAVLTDRDEIYREMAFAPCPTPVRFYKNMAHHLVGFDMSIVDHLENFILVRDPLQQLPSLAAGLGRVPTMRDAGFRIQIELVQRIIHGEMKPVVVDTGELLTDPRSVLTQLCACYDLPFEEAMLSWPAGPKPEDGVWASHWYARVHDSTGFAPYRPSPAPIPEALAGIYRECAPMYRDLLAYAIRA